MTVKPDRVLAAVVAAVVMLAAAAAVSVLRPPPALDTSTPEGTVQAFLQAVYDGDAEAAASFLAPDSGCDAGDIVDAYVERSARIVLVDTQVTGETARVEVEAVTSGSEGPFDSYEYRDERSFELRREDGRWVLVGSPWPLYLCEERRP